ncbi:hypothetical protein, partial [Ferrimicrobium acidiphilum]|uniref:hypothetical protein n=1 Tax=Ferrimicrobium acidiphilum TaxID=121039 RepID=UPI0023F48876
LAPENFAKRYESMEDGSYRAKGMCRAFPNPTGDDVSVTAPWGEEQHGGWDAMFAVAVDQARRQTPSFRAGKDRRILS